jgi:ABC-2 type transport system ATP-binding protein
MFEADALCDRIAMISGGEIVAAGTPSELKARVADRTVVEIETFDLPDGSVERLRAVPGVESVWVEEREERQIVLVQSPQGVELTQSLLGALDGAAVGRVVAREPTLEDAYVALVGGVKE